LAHKDGGIEYRYYKLGPNISERNEIFRNTEEKGWSIMSKITYSLALFLLLAVSLPYSQDDPRQNKRALLQSHPELQKLSYSKRIPKPKELSAEGKQALEAKGIKVLGSAPRLFSPRKDSLEVDKEIIRINVSLNLSSSGIEPIYVNAPMHSSSAHAAQETIMTDGFEGDFPGAKWQRSGDPTWGKTNYQSNSGSYSVWCAKDSSKGVEPGQGYPNNCRSMMIYGPFDLTDVNYGQLKFSYWLDTEYEKDWFYFMASTDGNNFQGIGVSGASGSWGGAWDEDGLHLNNVVGLGDVTGHSKVWIGFLFESDNQSSSDKGVFIDDVELTKRQINGTPLAGAVSGEFTASGNPYVAVDDFGIAEGDSLEIKPGVEIGFEEGAELIVLGLLEAIGTSSDSILFTSAKSNPAPGVWSGIGLYDVASPDCRIQYCRIEYGGYGGTCASGIYADTPEAEISNCLIWKNKIAGIWCGNVAPGSSVENCLIIKNEDGIYGRLSSTLIRKNVIAENEIGIDGFLSDFLIQENTIENNIKEGINGNTSDFKVINNVIRNNGSDGIYAGGAYLYISTTWIIVGNKILRNNGGGVTFEDFAFGGNIAQNIVFENKHCGIDVSGISSNWGNPRMKINNNTITHNDSVGIEFGNNLLFDSHIINNIVSDNDRSGIHFQKILSFNISYNDFYNNYPDFDTPTRNSLGILLQTNTNNDQCDPYFNISLSPLFMDANTNNFQLQQNSPCRNAGNPSAFFNNIDGTINDIGAYGGSLLCINFPKYDFGAVLAKDSREVDLRIENNRSNSFIISSLQLSDITNFSISQNFPIIISPYEQKSITVTFNPQSSGNYSATLNISSDGFYGNNSASVILAGKGINGTSVKGSVSGTWTRSGSPYIISDYTRVSEGKKLIIEPGVEIRFNGHYQLGVSEAQLQAVGTEKDSIVFTSHRDTEDSKGDGIYFMSGADTNKMIYCVVQKLNKNIDPYYGIVYEGIQISNSSNVLIANSRISDNDGPAISVDESTLIIENSKITNNGGNALDFTQSQAEISGCVIRNNEGIGINSHWGRGKFINIRNSIIAENQAGGLHLIYTVASLYNNFLVNNSAYHGGGIFFNSDSLVMINNVIFGNTAQRSGGGLYMDYDGPIFATNNVIRNNNSPSSPQIDYRDGLMLIHSNIQGGWEGKGNIDADPLFIDPNNYDFHLQPNSPCIDQGNPDSQYNDPEDPDNPGYALYPAMGTVRNDMGAYGGPGAAGGDFVNAVESKIEELANIPQSFELFQNYPNPFNPVTTIKYELPRPSEVTIIVHNMLGQVVRILAQGKQPAGYYSISWDGKDNLGQPVASGVYLYSLRTKDLIKTHKMAIIR
jgi:hypothetical protein